MLDNLALYNNVRAVPPEALRPIEGGRLKGKSDINPMWRIKTLTDQFGPCGLGWYYEITNQELETGSNGEISAFVRINLYVKYGEEWSKPIVGTGGSGFVIKEKNGMYTNDECFKMALTDAISVSCKSLGFGANVYWDKDRTKYDVVPGNNAPVNKKPAAKVETPIVDPEPGTLTCSDCGIAITQKVYDYSVEKKGVALCYVCQKK